MNAKTAKRLRKMAAFHPNMENQGTVKITEKEKQIKVTYEIKKDTRLGIYKQLKKGLTNE